ncbi:MAG: Gfo/Idh/MocA family oxidoreductase, partial [Planctomycetota bacterium]
RDGRVRISGLADINEKVLAERAKEFGVPVFSSHKELIEKARPEAVTIATPDPFHRQPALDAIRAGCHVLLEKPMDTSVDGCNEILAARRPGLLFEVDFHKRRDPYHAETRRRIAAGLAGEILYGHAYIEDRIEIPRDWFKTWAGESSPGWFIGIHFYDLAAWLLSDRAVRVHATAQKKILRSLGLDTLDAIQAKIEFSRGASVTVDASWILPDSFESVVNQSIRLVGTKGIIEIDSQDRGARSCLSGEGMSAWNLGFFHANPTPGGGERLGGYGAEMIEAFVDHACHLKAGGSIKDLDGLYCTGEEARHATAIAEAAHRSAETGNVEEVRG